MHAVIVCAVLASIFECNAMRLTHPLTLTQHTQQMGQRNESQRTKARGEWIECLAGWMNGGMLCLSFRDLGWPLRIKGVFSCIDASREIDSAKLEMRHAERPFGPRGILVISQSDRVGVTRTSNNVLAGEDKIRFPHQMQTANRILFGNILN